MGKAMKRKHGRDEDLAVSPEEIARQFLSDAIHQGDSEAADEAGRGDTARRQASRDEVTRTRRRLDLRSNAVQEGSLFDDEGDELGEVRSPEIDADDKPRRVTRARPPQL